MSDDGWLGELESSGGADVYLVAQAARTHAQRAEEKATSVEGQLSNLKERVWSKTDHDDFWDQAQAENAKARHRLNVLLTFSAIALAIIVLLVAWVIWHLDTVDETTDVRIAEIVKVAGESCRQSNDQLENTRNLYETLASTTTSASVAAELQNAASDLPDLVDCSTFDLPVKP